MNKANKTILVFGATGRMGGAAARHLSKNAWHVRAITRNPEGESARMLKEQGFEVLQGDMENPESLREAFKTAYGIFLVINGRDGGFEAELRQGKNVADLAAEAGIQHLVFAAAGTGEHNTGLQHFESKVVIRDYMQTKQIPLTMIYPTPFMELMTDKQFFPQVSVWEIKTKILGENRKIPWIATDDIGALAAIIFENPEKHIGKELKPVSDWKTMGECKQIYKEITGKNPPKWYMPVWVFRKMQPELVRMWEWMIASDNLKSLVDESLIELCGKATDVRSFLQQELVK